MSRKLSLTLFIIALISMGLVILTGINNAKWKSAIDWCENRGMEFKILTEKHLNPQYK